MLFSTHPMKAVCWSVATLPPDRGRHPTLQTTDISRFGHFVHVSKSGRSGPLSRTWWRTVWSMTEIYPGTDVHLHIYMIRAHTMKAVALARRFRRARQLPSARFIAPLCQFAVRNGEVARGIRKQQRDHDHRMAYVSIC